MLMKKLLSLLACVLTVATALKAQQPAYNSRFVYDSRVHDFGTIEEKAGRVSHTFTFTNKGRKPVAITDVQAWCGCTSADFTKQAVMPGGQGRVTVTYNPYNRPGKFSKEVVVMLNDGREYTRIWVKGDVRGYLHPVAEDHPYAYGEGLYMNFAVLPFPNLPVGRPHAFHLRLANDTDRPMKIDLTRQPDNTVLKLPRRLTLKSRERTTVRVSYTACRTYRHRRHVTIRPVVNGKPVRPLRVTWLPSAE